MTHTQKYKRWGRVALVALLLAFFIRTFWVESVVVSSGQMEPSLTAGDRLLVNKVAYGMRLPITPLTVPFTFDYFAGIRTYSDAIQLPYIRLGECDIQQCDVVLYNHPLQFSKPLDKRDLLLGRCHYLPGEQVQEKDWKGSPSEVNHPFTNLRLIVPRSGWKVKITPGALQAYGSIIQQEQSGAVLRDGQLFVQGFRVEEYTFVHDYFWLISDNRQEGQDSRHLGFVSEQNIVGKVAFVWFSRDALWKWW